MEKRIIVIKMRSMPKGLPARVLASPIRGGAIARPRQVLVSWSFQKVRDVFLLNPNFSSITKELYQAKGML
jgi:hypothetical protein